MYLKPHYAYTQITSWSCLSSLDQGHTYKNRFVCQASSCYTKTRKACIFPFKYAGRIYNQCIDLLNSGTPWCSTRVDSYGHHVAGHWDDCEETCPLNNCPVGYVRSFPDTTCYRISSLRERVESFDEAEDICQGEGARLWQPKVYASVSRLLNLEDDILNYDAYYATGMRKINGRTTYQNGELVDKAFSNIIPWNYSYTYRLNEDCYGLYKARFQRLSCEGYNTTTTPLYFICEARPMDDINGAGTCHFPFSYNNKVYSSCTYDDSLQMSKS